MSTNNPSVARKYLVVEDGGEPDPNPKAGASDSPENNGKPDTADAGKEAPTKCRRAHDRRGVELPVFLAELHRGGEPGEPWEAMSLDLSRSGVGLRSRRMVHHGRLVLLAVPPRGDRPGRLYCGRVMQSRYAEGVGYIVGIRFEQCPKGAHIDLWWNKHMKGRRAA